MKKTGKKLIALLLCSTLAVSLAGCGTADTGNDASTTATTAANGDQTTAPGNTTDTTAADTAKEEATLTAFIQQAVTSESGIWKGWGAEKLYADTKLKIDFHPTGNEVEQKLNQYLVAGDLPDLIGFKGLDQAQLAMNADLLLPLDDYKDQLPNIFSLPYYTDAVGYSQKYTSNDTGKLFIMPTAIGPASINAHNWVPLLKWDAYKKIGKPVINTLEDYLDVVEQMVAVEPVTKDGEKVYGFSLFSDWDKYSALEVSTLSYFYGIDTEYVSHLMETNVVTKEINSLLADNSFYKRALKFYFDANQRGLLDPDSMTQTYSNVDAKYSAGRVMFSHFSWMHGTFNAPASGHVDNPDNPDGYATVPAKDLKLYDAPDQTIGRNWYFAISKNCKNIDRALELLNWMYDPEVTEYLMNGPEGSVWEYVDGEPQITKWEIVDKKSEPLMTIEGGGAFQDGVYAFNTLGMQAATVMDDGYTVSYRYWPTSVARNAEASLMKKEVNEFLGAKTLAEYLEPNNMVAKSTQAVNMIPTISDELELTLSQIGEVVKKYSWQMIYSSSIEEFESLWKQMQTEADGLGMPKIVDFYTKAWNDAVAKVKDFE